MFAFRWDGANRLCTFQKLLCFVQEGEKRGDDIAWKQAAGKKYDATNSKERKAEVEDVDQQHPHQ